MLNVYTNIFVLQGQTPEKTLTLSKENYMEFVCIFKASSMSILEKTIATPRSNRLNLSLSCSPACTHKLAKPTDCLETGNASTLRLHKRLSAKLFA